MRIGVDVRCLMEGTRTGVEEYALGVLDAMLRAAPRDTFVLFANSRRTMRLPEFPSPNVELRTYHYPNLAFTLAQKVARRPRLERLLGGVDVLFLPSFRLAPSAPALPLVVTVHDLSFLRHPELFSATRRHWHWLMEPERLFRRAAAVIAVSRASASDLGTLAGVPVERIHVIPSGIPGEVAAATPRRAPAAIVRAHGIRPPYLLYLGTLEPRKNLDALLFAYARVRAAGFPHTLVLAGRRGWLGESFFIRVRTHPWARDIQLTGFIEDADKPAVYGNADLFVYPSLYEGFGFPPLEALAAGTPVVTSFNSAIPEVAGPWVALVNPSDPDELKETIIDRLRDGTRVPESVSANVRARYSWDRAGEDTLRVLRDAAGAI